MTSETSCRLAIREWFQSKTLHLGQEHGAATVQSEFNLTLVTHVGIQETDKGKKLFTADRILG